MVLNGGNIKGLCIFHTFFMPPGQFMQISYILHRILHILRQRIYYKMDLEEFTYEKAKNTASAAGKTVYGHIDPFHPVYGMYYHIQHVRLFTAADKLSE